MGFVEKAGKELDVWEEDPKNWTMDKALQLYGGMHHALQIQEEIKKLRDEMSRLQTTLPSSGFGENSFDQSNSNGGGGGPKTTLYSYDGRFNILPLNYEVLKLTFASFISFYLIGIPNEGIPPF